MTTDAVIFCDGSGSGKCAVAVLNKNNYGETLKTSIYNYLVDDNNESEYLGLYNALKKAQQLGADDGRHVTIYTDSMVVYSHMHGEEECFSERLFPYYNMCKRTIEEKKLNVSIEWVPSENNKAGWLLDSIRQGMRRRSKAIPWEEHKRKKKQ